MTETQTTTTTAPATPAATVPAGQCTHTVNTEKGPKPCVKPAGHDTVAKLTEEHGKGHASRLQKRKEYKKVNKSVINSAADVADDLEVTYGAVGAQAAERDENQKQVDTLVKDAYQKWVVAGKPQSFNDSPRKRFWVNPEDEESMRAMLRSAGRLHGVSVRIAPLQKHQNGKTMLVWAACDIKKHAPKPTAGSPGSTS